MLPASFISVLAVTSGALQADVQVRLRVEGQIYLLGDGVALQSSRGIRVEATARDPKDRQVEFWASTETGSLQLTGDVTAYEDFDFQGDADPSEGTVWQLLGDRVQATILFQTRLENPPSSAGSVPPSPAPPPPPVAVGYYDDDNVGCWQDHEYHEDEEEDFDEGGGCGGYDDEDYEEEDFDEGGGCGGYDDEDHEEEDDEKVSDEEDETSGCSGEPDPEQVATRMRKQRDLARAVRFCWPIALVLGANRGLRWRTGRKRTGQR